MNEGDRKIYFKLYLQLREVKQLKTLLINLNKICIYKN